MGVPSKMGGNLWSPLGSAGSFGIGNCRADRGGGEGADGDVDTEGGGMGSGWWNESGGASCWRLVTLRRRPDLRRCPDIPCVRGRVSISSPTV